MSQHSNHYLSLFNLTGKTAILTGGTGHLGTAMAQGLLDAGAIVILISRNAQRLQEVSQQLRFRQDQLKLCAVDITDEQAVQQQLISMLDKTEGVNILVNNAYSGIAKPDAEATLEDFRLSYEVTVTAAYHLIKVCLPFFKKAQKFSDDSSSIINISSMYGKVSPDPRIYGDSNANNPPYYGAAKAGLIQLSKYLACHYAPQAIRVNTISPGPFPPASIKQNNSTFYQKLCDKLPSNRIGEASEIVGPLLFLASPASSFVTGTDIAVDGGWTAW